MRWLELKIPPPLVAALVALAMWLAQPLGPVLALDQTLGAALHQGLTGGLVLLGVGIDLAGLAAFLAARTTVNPLRPERSSRLVVGGVYRFTRNPMYLGLLCLLSAWGLWLQAGAALAGPLVFAAYITRFQIVPEERVLHATFGPAYARYVAQVRRWF